jgi:hypothetical protein
VRHPEIRAQYEPGGVPTLEELKAGATKRRLHLRRANVSGISMNSRTKVARRPGRVGLDAMDLLHGCALINESVRDDQHPTRLECRRKLFAEPSAH